MSIKYPQRVEDLAITTDETLYSWMTDDSKQMVLEIIYNNNFKCAKCWEVFAKWLTEEEADEQYKKEFPYLSNTSVATDLWCDQCYNKCFNPN